MRSFFSHCGLDSSRSPLRQDSVLICPWVKTSSFLPFKKTLPGSGLSLIKTGTPVIFPETTFMTWEVTSCFCRICYEFVFPHRDSIILKWIFLSVIRFKPGVRHQMTEYVIRRRYMLQCTQLSFFKTSVINHREYTVSSMVLLNSESK